MDDLKCMMLRKLVNANMWGGKHTPLDFLRRGLPEHYRMTHQGQKAIEKTLKELANDGWIVLQQKRTGKDYDTHISLNPRKIGEITRFLEKKL